MTNVDELAGLTKLTALHLPYPADWQDGVKLDISGLSGLTGLQTLNTNGELVSLEPLRTMTGLREVHLSNAADWQHPLKSLDAFSGLTNLRSLQIGYVAEGTDTSPVSQVTDLNINFR